MPPNLSASNILCYVTDRTVLTAKSLRIPSLTTIQEDADSRFPFEALVANIATAAAAGVDWIQLREKDLAARDCALLTRAALQVCSAAATRVLVNDRLDVALAEHAAGVHLGENSLPIRQVRGVLSTSAGDAPKEFLTGVSCHSVASAEAAAVSGADYIFFGPVF